MKNNKGIPEYTKKAINKYNSKFDRCAVNLPIGSKQIIADNTGKSVNQFLNDLFQDWKKANNIQ
jgi:hypothetical protein